MEPFAVQPGFGERLAMLCSDAGLSKAKRVAYIAQQTGRTRQAVENWFQDGNPDIVSFAQLCQLFAVDGNWLLGLTRAKVPLPQMGEGAQSALAGPWGSYLGRYLTELGRECARNAPGHLTLTMPSDEMAPRIRKGALLIVLPGDTVSGNGLYVLEYQGQITVRTLEQRLGGGVVLSCDNPGYAAQTFKDLDAMVATDIRVVGPLAGWHQLNWV